MRKLLLFILIGSCLTSMAQLTSSEFPLGYSHRESVSSITANLVKNPTQEEIQSLIDGNHPSSGEMYVIGKNQPVDLDVTNSGVWTSENGFKVWRLKIKSDGAKALALLYSDFYLPKNSQVNVYNTDFTHKSRSYLSNENEDGGSFATEPIIGNEIILEYRALEWTTESPIIHLEAVSYIFRSEETYSPKDMGENGDSGPCQINVNCSEGNAWQDQKRGIAKIFIIDDGLAGGCSGSLINNTSSNCKNYFLTAQHCGGGASSSDLGQWVFYFNFESSSCSNITDIQADTKDNQTMTGCQRRASSGTISDAEASDFLLVEINGTVPKAYNVFYNGWDKSNVAAASGVSIHHPAGDIKKISTFVNTLQSSSWGAINNTHWANTWDATANGQGDVEPGSSGAPLFNQSKKIVGQLTGGIVGCNDPNSFCLSGKFSFSWNTAGAANEFQLEPWLDPTGTGSATMNGRNTCPALAVPSANFSGVPLNIATGSNVSFTESCTNNPTTFAWNISPIAGTIFQSGTTSASSDPIIQFNNAGTYTVSLTASNGAGSDTETKTNYITVFDNTDIQENAFHSSILIFPNPVDDLVNISFNKSTQAEVEITIIDMLGKTLSQHKFLAGTTFIQLPISDFSSGIYSIRIKSGQNQSLQKIMKN